jgi:signal transduction histidine kinase
VIGIPVERLPGVLGHELRNPLASALTGVMLAREMVDAGDPRAAVLDGVLTDLDRITALIDGWLATARGKEPVRTDFRVLAMLERVAARHGAQLVCAPDDTALHGNAPLLERALDNLVENARQAGARTVRLAAQALGAELTVHVEDDGCGIAAADLPQIFRAGFSGRGGNGLGLYSVATTVAAHGGSIGCQPLARGTRFSLKLPLQSADAVCP